MIRLSGVVGLSVFAVHGYVNGLSAHDLACRSNQWHETGGAANRWDKFHSLFEHVFSAKSAKVSHHVRVHTAWHFGVLNDFVRLRESEVLFDGVTCFEHSFFVVSLASFDSLIE